MAELVYWLGKDETKQFDEDENFRHDTWEQVRHIAGALKMHTHVMTLKKESRGFVSGAPMMVQIARDARGEDAKPALKLVENEEES
jgi:hypothetical protein